MWLVRSRRLFMLFMLGISTYVCFKTLFSSSVEVQQVTRLATSSLLSVVTAVTSLPAVKSAVNRRDSCLLDALDVIPSTARKARCTNCQALTCRAILFSNHSAKVFKRARMWMKAHPVKMIPNESYVNFTKDCRLYQASRGFHMKPVFEEEANYPIAYNVIMHRDIQQIERLLRAIYRPQNEYCIHVDAKQHPGILNAMQRIAGCFPNVRIASKLERVTYAGFSRLQADINCMDDLLNRVSTKWHYLINIAGQSFPLKTNLEMVQTLKIYNGSNDIEGIIGRGILRNRFENEWVESGTNTSHPRLRATYKKNPNAPFDIDIVRGSAYGIFSRGFVDFILNDKKAKALLRWSQRTWSPDEHYWATLHHLYTNPHLKTPGGYPGKPDQKPWLAAYSAWIDHDKCTGMWKHRVCVFGVADLSSLLKRREFFANKFYMTFQPFALDCIEEWLEFKVRCPQLFDRKYYASLPFVQANLRPWGQS